MHSQITIACILVGILAVKYNAEPGKPTSLWLYYGNNTNNHNIYVLSKAVNILQDPNFNPDLPTVVYIHGWTEQPSYVSIQTVVGAYLQTRQWNTIILDTDLLSSLVYQVVLDNAEPLGKRLGRQLVNLFDSGLSLFNFHLIGHSFGAHVAAYTGRYVKEFSNQRYTLPRLTGLDPANERWYDNGPYVPISRWDAEFVDIIHTDAGEGGAPTSTGTIDFWPNGGVRPQPGCPTNDPNNLTDYCNHQRSWHFWAESVNATNPSEAFLAVRASSWEDFKNGFADAFYPINMGINTPIGITGDWYLQTNAKTPYSRGYDGIEYNPQ